MGDVMNDVPHLKFRMFRDLREKHKNPASAAGNFIAQYLNSLE
jgi:hypothetical protein